MLVVVVVAVDVATALVAEELLLLLSLVHAVAAVVDVVGASFATGGGGSMAVASFLLRTKGNWRLEPVAFFAYENTVRYLSLLNLLKCSTTQFRKFTEEEARWGDIVIFFI